MTEQDNDEELSPIQILVETTIYDLKQRFGETRITANTIHLILKEVIEIDDEIATSRKATRNDVSIEEVVNKEAVSKEKSLVKIDEVSQKTKPEPMATELKAFFKLNKKQPQIIEVNTEKEFTVTCKEGTILTIPAKSFVDANTGKLARGKINLEVTEYYKLSDMLLANLTTKADGKQLETGGMLYLDANKKDEKLKLKPGRKIQIVFNNKGKKRMQLFSGEENSEGVNWKLQTEKNGSIEEDVEVDFSTIEIVPTYPGCENLSNNDKRKCMNDAINKIVSRKFDMEIAENLGLKGKHKIVIDFRIDKKGNVGEVNARASRKEVADEAVRVIEFLPQFIPGKQRGKPVRTRYSLVFNIQLEGKNTESSSVVFVKSDKNFIETFEKRLDSIESSNGILGTISNDHIARYAFATTKLGWINCDRFVNSKKQKVKFKLKIKDPNGTNVKMVFKSMSSILPSKKFADEFDFGLLPIDEEVIVIAIKKTKDKLYLAKKEMQTKRNPDLKLDFKEVTIQELKMELENLNSSF